MWYHEKNMDARRGDTERGGDHREFPSTAWTDVLAGGGAEGARRSIEFLAENYWKPIYSYLRARWSKSGEEAADLTQAFFLTLLEGDVIRRADPDRGRFRAFVKTALTHFMVDEGRRARALKRGGGLAIRSLEAGAAYEAADPRGRPPDEIFDRAWRGEVLARAARLLEDVLRREGKEVTFQVFSDCYLSGSTTTEYRPLAEKFGISLSDVSNHLVHAKKRFNEAVRTVVAGTVAGAAELEEELAQLFGAEPP